MTGKRKGMMRPSAAVEIEAATLRSHGAGAGSELPVLRSGVRLTEVEEAQWLAGVVIPFDKPAGWSSFDVIRAVRPRLPVKKIGHAGTLDPLATGLLLCCTGKATKRISELQNLPKTYLADIRLGRTSPSLDHGTPVSETAPWDGMDPDRIESLLTSKFVGEIDQLPPDFSALKVGGRRAYDLARKGLATGLEPRKVVVHHLRVLQSEADRLRLEVVCGKGTYIRALARDAARALGTVGMLDALRRTESGGIAVEHAWNPDDFRRDLSELST